MVLWSMLFACGFPTCGTADVAGTGLSFVNAEGSFSFDETYDMYCGERDLSIGGSLTYRAPDAGIDEQVVLSLGPHEHPDDVLIVDALLSHDFRIPPDDFAAGARFDLAEIQSSAGISGITGSGAFVDEEGNSTSELYLTFGEASGWLEITDVGMTGDCDTGDGSLDDTAVNYWLRIDFESTHSLDGASVTSSGRGIWLSNSGFLNTNPALGVSPVGRLCGRFGTL